MPFLQEIDLLKVLATLPSIPAKAGISAAISRIRRQATIAMFRFAENSRCRENEIPAFAGMEGGGRRFPFSGLAGISRLGE